MAAITIPSQRLVVAALITIWLQNSKLSNPVASKFIHHFGEFQNTNGILLCLWVFLHILDLNDLSCSDLNLNEKKRNWEHTDHHHQMWCCDMSKYVSYR